MIIVDVAFLDTVSLLAFWIVLLDLLCLVWTIHACVGVNTPFRCIWGRYVTVNLLVCAVVALVCFVCL